MKSGFWINGTLRTGDAVECSAFSRQFIPENVDALSGCIDGNFEDLIRKIGLLIQVFQDNSK